jgi:hypothetical protein
MFPVRSDIPSRRLPMVTLRLVIATLRLEPLLNT